MPFAQPDFCWKDALLGICVDFCCALWFDLKRPCFFLVFKVPALETCSFFLRHVSIFLHSEECWSIVLGNLTVHVMCFSQSFSEQIRKRGRENKEVGGSFWDCCSNATALSQEDHGWIIFMVVALGSDALHSQFIQEESVLEGMKNMLARRSSWLLILEWRSAAVLKSFSVSCRHSTAMCDPRVSSWQGSGPHSAGPH